MKNHTNTLKISAIAVLVMAIITTVDVRLPLIAGGVALLFLTGDTVAPMAAHIYNNVRERLKTWI